jgi:hypothetical protein
MAMLSKFTLFLDVRMWHAFRKACIDRQTSASKELRRLIYEQLVAWDQVPTQETDHA